MLINTPENWANKNDTQGEENDTQECKNDTQEVLIPDKKDLDKWIERQIMKNPKITTIELARMSRRSVSTIKRHIFKLNHIRFVGSGFSGYWEICGKDIQE